MNADIDLARIELRRKLGQGARYDAANAPSRELDWARRGTAYFARILNDLSEIELNAASRLEGIRRSQIIGYVGCQARMLSGIVAWARNGGERQWPHRFLVQRDTVNSSATLPARALRNLFQHSEVHLNVEWRDLSDGQWDTFVEDISGSVIQIRDTPLIRARAIWLHAIDLGAGGRLVDLPTPLQRDVSLSGHDVRRALMDAGSCD